MNANHLQSATNGLFEKPVKHLIAKKKKDIRDQYQLSKNMIARWIEPHLEKFERIGYKKNQRTFTPAQVALFESIFGGPDEDELL